MNALQALILGVVQGLAEFLPVSSSGHLRLLQRVFGFAEPAATFDIVAHLGTLGAVAYAFRKDIASIIKKPAQKMTGLLVVATLPAIAAGLLFKDIIGEFFWAGPPLAAAFALTGVLLIIADRFSGGKKTGKDMTYLDAVVIGLMQAAGIPPGVSRSGATLTGAFARGFERETAARFSFLLAAIAIAGAGALEAYGIVSGGAAVTQADLVPMAVVFISSAAVGYLAVRTLLAIIKKCRLRYFSWYLFALASLILLDSLVFKAFFV